MISIQDREKIKSEFNSISSLYDLSRFLNTTQKQLIYYTVILPEEQRYSTFFIPKKNGGARQISAPVKTLKYLQKQLALKLQVLYEPLNVVHGFLKEYENKEGLKVKPTIVTNAATHVRKKFILNIDLENFFPTVSKKRVYGLFKNQYSLNSKIASYLTFICCTENGLPQGAPTSPIITNMICSRLDRKLRRLSSENYVTYSRYADDLSFSTSKKKFPLDFESKVNEIIKAEGFSLNEKKRRLHLRENRLEVTGLTVNLKPNVQRRYVRNLRAIFHSIEKHGINAAAENYVKIKNVSINDPAESLKRYLKGKIEYLSQVKGKDDPVYIKFKQKFLEVFEPNKRIKDIPNSASMDFNYERLKLLEEYNSEIVSSIKEASDELKNIKKRINQKLEKAVSILVSKDEKNYYETIYLIWYSCLNEFQKMHFSPPPNIEEKAIFLDGEKVDEKKYYKNVLYLHSSQNIRYLTIEKPKNSQKSSSERDSKQLSLEKDNNTSSRIFIYLFERFKGKNILEFAWLNKIRNTLNLTHSDDNNIIRQHYYERVSWLECSWLFQFIYFLFTSQHLINDNIFLKNPYLNQNISVNAMTFFGEIKERNDKNPVYFYLVVNIIDSKLNFQHEMKFSTPKGGHVFSIIEKEGLDSGDWVTIDCRFSVYKYINNIQILDIKREANPNFSSQDNKQTMN